MEKYSMEHDFQFPHTHILLSPLALVEHTLPRRAVFSTLCVCVRFPLHLSLKRLILTYPCHQVTFTIFLKTE